MSEQGSGVPTGSNHQTTGSSTVEERGTTSGPQEQPRRFPDNQRYQDHLPIPHSNGDLRIQHAQPRLLGVHNILNPSEPRTLNAEGGPVHLPRTRSHIDDAGHSPSISQPTFQKGYFTGQHGTGSQPGTPAAPTTGFPDPQDTGRISPSNYSQPSIQNPRRILSPKGPRTASLNFSSLSRDPDVRMRTASASPAKRPYEPEHPEDFRGYASRHPASVPHTPNIPGATISRSTSQPVVQPQSGPHIPPVATLPRDPRAQSPLSPQISMHYQGSHGVHSYPPSGASATAPEQGINPWGESMLRPTAGMVAMRGDGQHAFMTLPGSDIPIEVPVDRQQASKKASEKRQRNASASTRHRQKRKALQEESARQLQDLKDEREEMELKIEELRAQRDFYRNDRNRLRDIVRATPAIAELATGPPSPALSRPGETSPHLRSHHAATPSHEYGSEASSVERPAQRPRVHERSEGLPPSYGPPSSGASGPQTPLQYGLPPRPTSASSSTGAGERLPPLRSMEGHGPGQGPPLGHGPHEQDPRTGQWVPIQPRHYENPNPGWATGAPRKPSDTSQR